MQILEGSDLLGWDIWFLKDLFKNCYLSIVLIISFLL